MTTVDTVDATAATPDPPGAPGRPARRRRRWPLVVTGALAIVLGGWLVVRWAVRPDAPGAFYRPPAELPDGPAGTIIRQEDVDGVPADRRAWRVLYTSTAPDGSPIAVSGVVVAPSGEPPAGGWPVVAWAHGTTGVASRCAPSLETGAGTHLVPELDALLAGGTVVAITDYAGLGTPGPHPYLVGESEGRAVLDSIHAARALLGSEAATTAAVFGHSQGGHAAVFAAGWRRRTRPTSTSSASLRWRPRRTSAISSSSTAASRPASSSPPSQSTRGHTGSPMPISPRSSTPLPGRSSPTSPRSASRPPRRACP